MKNLRLLHCVTLFYVLVFFAEQQAFAQSSNVGIGTTSPLARLHVADSAVLFSGPISLSANPSPPPVSGVGTRMMWYPQKAAFRVGGIISFLPSFRDSAWDMRNIGRYSFASGASTKASGAYSTSVGDETEAIGDGSFSSGYRSTALGNYSFATGASNANGRSSASFGQGTANGDYSVAMGDRSDASGYASMSIGMRNKALGGLSFSMGGSTIASGSVSTSMGEGTVARSYASIALGLYNDSIISSKPDVVVLNDPLFIIGNGTRDSDRRNAMIVLKNGNTGIGTSAPQQRLEVVGESGAATRLMLANKGGFGPAAVDFVSDYGLTNQWRPCYILSGDASPGNFTGKLEFYTNGTGVANKNGSVKGFEIRNGVALTATGTVASFSDSRLKRNVRKFSDGLNVIDQIQPVSFEYNSDAPFPTDQTQVGVVAQQLEKAAPYMVHQTDHNGINDVRYVDNQAYTFLLINAVKELKKENEDLKKRIEKLEKK